MIRRVGITGQNGFIGWHLYQTLKLSPDKYELVKFDRSYFEVDEQLDEFVKACDVIVHLAGLNRHHDENEIYRTNTDLPQKIVASLERTGVTPHVIMSSSTQEERDNPYGRSKKKGRKIFANWATNHNAVFTGMILPNVFGPFGKPFYNSFIATFCHQLCNGDESQVQTDAEVPLIYVADVIAEICNIIDACKAGYEYSVTAKAIIKVSAVLEQLKNYKELYLGQGIIPKLQSKFDVHLFNTFRSYVKHESIYPRKFTAHEDERGTFVELIRLGTGGQVSFSTTKPGITRGNHFHTRKIERFAVIRGEAQIQLRKIATDEILNFQLNGASPAYVDMPVWYTHNITNTGRDELFTVFWINEWYNPDDADTYLEQV